jgi:prephenate dehydrogenase
MDFEKVAILGGGLLGGSIALALQRSFPSLPVALWARRPETIALAKERGIAGADADLGICLRGAGLVILTTPVGAMPGLVLTALEQGLEPGTLVTDVGSVKAPVHRELGPLLAEKGIHFVGSHPMAGSDRTGVEAAGAGLFEGAACFVTDDEQCGPAAVARLTAFWEALGCHVHAISAGGHDALVARISHFPHAMAAATARVALVHPEDAVFGGGGLRDTTRVAGGDPGMWAEIFMENREALAISVQRCLSEMSEMLAMLQAGDHEAVRGWLAGAKSARDHVRPATPSDFP